VFLSREKFKIQPGSWFLKSALLKYLYAPLSALNWSSVGVGGAIFVFVMCSDFVWYAAKNIEIRFKIKDHYALEK
jgi:hypothetical protein